MNNLRKYRCLNNLTQEELGKRLGIGKASISLFERPEKKTKLPKKTAEKMTNILGCSIFELYGWDNFLIIPKTKEDKLYLINLLQSSLETENKD